MDIKKLVPWNWLQKEEEGGGSVLPAKVGTGERGGESHPLLRLHREMDRLFADAFHGFPGRLGGVDFAPAWSGLLKPQVDIGADDKSYTITIEVPGVDEKDVTIEISEDTLVVSGEKKQEKEEKEKDFYRMERSYGSFRRVLCLPEDVDRDGIKAAFKKGILTITMPRRAPAKKAARRIEVKSEKK
ncbi:Hsp20/alpha crystallin family protein [Desulfurivibrio sp. D14AmB]|uniref:Hsp20/alpha crystallin family protein n=1 Tax=Desulfurivibrio sp. D14AmB TaxID=3374370 RepID=UPI00376F073F